MSDFVKLMAVALPLQFALFFLIYRFTRLRGKQVTLLVIALSLAAYVPFGIIFWESLDQFAYRVAFFVTFPYLFGIVTSPWEAAEERGEQRDGSFFHWAPMTMFFFFIAIASVDAIIISLADKGMSGEFAAKFLPPPRSQAKVVSYFPGNVSHDFQEKEALFNAHMAQLERQKRLGWKIRKGWLGKPVAGQPSRFKLVIEGPDGKRVTGATIEGQFLRPGNHRLDTSFTMAEDSEDGYVADLALPAPGRWNVVIVIRRGDDRYELKGSTSVNESRQGGE